MPEGSELAGELGVARGLDLAPRRKIPPPEQVGGRYDCRSQGTVLIGTLRPGEIAIQPKIVAQTSWYIAMGQIIDRGQQVVIAEGLAQHPAFGKSRCQVDVGSGGNIERLSRGAPGVCVGDAREDLGIAGEGYRAAVKQGLGA